MDPRLESQLKKIRAQTVSKENHQQQHAAILLAVEETIKEQNTPAEPSSYFATLLTLLEQQQQQTGDGSQDTISGTIIYLLSVILPHVSHNVLRAKFSTMMAVLSQSLDLGSADVALLKSVISSLETVLLAQDAASWGQPVAQGTFQSLLSLSTDSKPKIRRRAQEAISKLLLCPPPPSATHPAAPATVRFVLEALAEAKSDTQAALHTLQLVKSTDMMWPAEEFSSLCKALMNLPKLNTPFLTTLSFQALESVLSSAAEALEEDDFRDLLINIVDIKPNVNDPVACEAWHKIIHKGYVAYSTVNPEACFQSLPDLIDLVFPDIELGKQSTREAATQCVWATIRQCIPDSKLVSTGIEQIVNTFKTGLSYRYRESWTLVFLLIAALLQRLDKFSHPVMDELIVEVANMRMEPEFELKNEADAVLGAAVRAVGPQAFLEILPLNLGDSSQGQVGRAWLLPLMKGHIRNTPLQYFVDNMLPLADSLLAQSRKFTSINREIEAKVFNALNQQVWALLGGFCNVPVDTLDTFTPEFAQRLAKEMLESVELRPTICAALQTLLTAVHSLARDDSGTGPLTQHQAQAAEQHLAQFASDFLAQLFNIFAQSPGASRGYMMGTITAFLNITNVNEVNDTFTRVCAMLDTSLSTHTPPTATQMTERYLEANPPPHAHTMMDLAMAMLTYLDAERLEMLARAAFMLAKQSEDQTLQKKGYKTISKLAEQPEGSAARQLVASSMSSQLIPMLVESAESVAISSRRERLSLIASLSTSLPDDQLHFIPAMLSEVILGTKEANERARIMAFDSLLTMGRRMAQGGVISMDSIANDGDDTAAVEDMSSAQQVASIEEFFKMTAAGLAAQTPHMISATIAAISRSLFEFHTLLDTNFIVDIMSTVLMFVVNNNREIAKASLGFVKVIAVVLPKETLEPHLGEIVPSILKWSYEYKNQMRLKCRHILDRLARRLGLEAVEKVTPEEHMKLIANMRKIQTRSKRSKEAYKGKNTEEDTQIAAATAAGAAAKSTFGNAYEDVLYGSEDEMDDSDSDMEDAGMNSKNQKNKKKNRQFVPVASNNGGGAWIKEDAEGPLDFLDRTAFTHFSTNNPSATNNSNTKARRAPKMKNGKLVFEDPEEEKRKQAKIAAAAAAAAAGSEDKDMGAGDEDYYMQSLTSKDAYYRTPGQKIKFMKRKADDMDDDEDVVMVGEGNEEGQSTLQSRKPSRKLKRENQDGGVRTGKEFRAKKAQGDVKRGNVDPFAYIPLNPKTLKKGTVSVKGNAKRAKRMRNNAAK